MQRHELTHEIHCLPARMWELFFDDTFNVQMYCEGLGFPKCEIPEKREQAGVLYRRMEMIPKIEVPKPLAKIMGDRVGFTELGEWHKSKGVYKYKLILAAFGEKVRIEGTMRLLEQGVDHSRRVTAFEVESSIFGIGGLIEKTSADNVINGWNFSAGWINKWLAEQTTGG